MTPPAAEGSNILMTLLIALLSGGTLGALGTWLITYMKTKHTIDQENSTAAINALEQIAKELREENGQIRQEWKDDIAATRTRYHERLDAASAKMAKMYLDKETCEKERARLEGEIKYLQEKKS